MFELSRTWRRRMAHGVSYVFLVTVGLTMVFPLLWMLLTSVKTPAADVLDPAEWWPRIPWRLGKRDIRSWPAFCRRFHEGDGTVESAGRARLWQLIPEKPRRTLTAVSERDAAPAGRRQKLKASQLVLESEKGIILAALNEVLERGDLCVDPAFAGLPLPEEARRSLGELGDGGARSISAGQTGTNGEQASHLSRLLFDACFPEDVVSAHRFHWENYRTVVVEINFARALFNSFLVTVTVTFGMVFTSSLAAFAFARLTFTGRDRIFLSYLATMMIPGAVTMIPVFILMRELHWVNTYYALIFPGMFSAYGTFMLRQFFMGIPRELEEASILDGCSVWGVYRHVVIPLSRPALAALTILTFMGAWRGFMWPLIVTNAREMFTLPVALAAFKEMHGVRWTLMMAGSVIMIVPMFIVFVCGQRYFIEGIRLGAIKG